MTDLVDSVDEAVGGTMADLTISPKPPHPAPDSILPKVPPGVIPLSGASMVGARPIILRAGAVPPRLVTADGKPIVLRARGPVPPGTVLPRPLLRPSPPPAVQGSAAAASSTQAVPAPQPSSTRPSPTPEDVACAEALGQAGLHGAMARDVRPWLDLIESLRQEGVHEDMPLPQIAVMGDQSSGKSSVLEALSGVHLPRGVGLVTRCPIQLNLRRAGEGGQQWTGAAWVQPAGGRGMGPRVEVPGPAQLTGVIRRLMDDITGGDPNMLSSDCVMVELSSPHLPDLTLVDLPGIVRTSTAGQPESVIRDVDRLIQSYLNQERTIILCVIPANQDISTIDILERAYQVDPEGDRTIGVLTKPDLINPGAEDEVLAVMKNVRKPLKLGYVMVKNRSQAQLNAHQALAQAQAEELAFLRAHPAFAALPDAQLGVCSLATRLTRVLVSRIHACLPFMKHELGEKLRATCRQVEALGEPGPVEAGQCRSAVMHIITKYSKVLRESLRGDYREQSLVTRPELRIRALTEAAFRQIQSTMQGTRPDFNSKQFLENLAKKVVALRGRELPGFCNSVFFHGYMMQYVEQWRGMVDANRAGLVEAIRRAVSSIMPAVAPNHPRLADVARDVVTEAFVEIENGLDASLEEVFAREHDPFTVNDDLTLAVDRVRFERFDDVCGQALEAVKNDPSFREGHKAIQASFLSQLGGWYMANHGADLDAKVGDQQTVLMAYFGVCVKRVLDNVCMVIENKLLQAIPDTVMTELVNTLQCRTEEAMLELFVEDEHTTLRRKGLQTTQRRLSAAIDLITTVAPEVVARPKPANKRNNDRAQQHSQGWREEGRPADAPPAAAAQGPAGIDKPAVPTAAGSSGRAEEEGRHEGGVSEAEREGRREGAGCVAAFRFSHTGDKQGFIHWLGTGGGAHAFRNPHDDKKIQITSSGMAKGMSESTLVSRKRLACWTEDGGGKADTWVALDFAGHGFAPTHYTLCNGSPDPGFDFRGWALEGWSDKQRSWVMLDAPNSGSQSKLLTSPFGANTFQVTNVDPTHRFRRLRLRSCAPNTLGTHSIPLCALELYGRLYASPN